MVKAKKIDREQTQPEMEEQPKTTDVPQFDNITDKTVYDWYVGLQSDEHYNIYQAAEQLKMPVQTFEESLQRMQGRQLPSSLTHITPS